jgi:pantothenate kinase
MIMTSAPTPGAGPDPQPVTMDELIAAARRLINPPERRFLGITGAPGAGKSTVAETLAAALAPDALLVGMDGFHLRDDELRRLGRYERKGARDTFDAAGYVNLLRRLRERRDPVVYAPLFDRGLEESIGSAVPVPRETPLIITEGNYLLVDDPVWGEVAGLLDECWYVDPGEDVRLGWLVARHVRYGRSADEAAHRSYGSDAANAALTAGSRHRANWIVQLTRTG